MAVSVMLYIVTLASAPRMLLLNSQLRRPMAKFLIACSAAYSHMKISCGTVNPWILYRKEELGDDRYGCRYEIQRDHLQHSRDCKSKQSETI